MINYDKLWSFLRQSGYKKTDLINKKIISPATLSKLSKNGTVTTETIDKLCEFLHCRVEDIIEYVSAEKMVDSIIDSGKLGESEKLSILEAIKKAYLAGFNHMQEMSEEEFEKVKKTPGGPLGNKETRQMAAKTVREIKNETFLAQRDNNRKKKHKDVQTGAENDSLPANKTEAADQLMQVDENQKTDKHEPQAD